VARAPVLLLGRVFILKTQVLHSMGYMSGTQGDDEHAMMRRPATDPIGHGWQHGITLM
jgi:hypothetical protein